MSHSCKDSKKIKRLKARDICVKNLKADNIDAKIADIDSAVINNADITNLDVQNLSIGGNDLSCLLSAPAVAQTTNSFVLFGVTGATGPFVPTNVDPEVYDCLLQNAINDGIELKKRIADGRDFINQYLADFPCPPTCPPPPSEPVPLEIYGTLTLPIYNRVPCGPTGSFNNFLNTAVNFNLQVAYLLEEAKSIDARVVSVLVQVGYVDPLGPTGGCTGSSKNVVIEEVFLANKQFYPTLDVTYGENFANTIQIPSFLSSTAYVNSPNPTLQGAIQMVIYKEEGLCIWTPNSSGFECLGGGGGNTQNPPAGAQQQVPPTCPKGNVLCNLGTLPACVPCVQCNAPLEPCNPCPKGTQLCGVQGGKPQCVPCGQCNAPLEPCNN